MAFAREILEQFIKEHEMFFLLMMMLVLWLKQNAIPKPRQSLCVSELSGKKFLHELLNGPSIIMYQLFRMDRHAFSELSSHLRERGFLTDSKHVDLEEKLAMFLLTIGHDESNRMVKHRFQHSGHTISKCLHEVLRAILKFSKEMIVPPAFDKPMPPIRTHRQLREGPFKCAIGALDGTLINAVVPKNKRIPFRGRGGKKCLQNVMVVCDFDMKFLYVVAGWEGATHDSRVLVETVRDPTMKFPLPPPDKYYLCDLAYTHTRGFMAPYRNQRYWLSSWNSGPPIGKEEKFNRAHARLRNVIERTFGVLKSRFPILNKMPSYTFRTQVRMVVACMCLHNYLRRYSLNDPLFQVFEDDDMDVNNNVPMDFEDPIAGSHTFRPQDQVAMIQLRDQIANEWMSPTQSHLTQIHRSLLWGSVQAE